MDCTTVGRFIQTPGFGQQNAMDIVVMQLNRAVLRVGGFTLRRARARVLNSNPRSTSFRCEEIAAVLAALPPPSTPPALHSRQHPETLSRFARMYPMPAGMPAARCHPIRYW
jgi:hypothetical protein